MLSAGDNVVVDNTAGGDSDSFAGEQLPPLKLIMLGAHWLKTNSLETSVIFTFPQFGT